MKKAKRLKPPTRIVIVSEPAPTSAQLEHIERLKAEGFRVQTITERSLLS